MLLLRLSDGTPSTVCRLNVAQSKGEDRMNELRRACGLQDGEDLTGFFAFEPADWDAKAQVQAHAEGATDNGECRPCE